MCDGFQSSKKQGVNNTKMEYNLEQIRTCGTNRRFFYNN